MKRTKDIVCRSVVGGWQSAFEDSEILFGPVFNSTGELWQWQRENLYVNNSDGEVVSDV